MRLENAGESFKGVPARDVFMAYSDSNSYLGYGLIYASEKKELSPNVPLQIFIEINALDMAKPFILGALLARAGQMKRQRGNLKARLFTILNPEKSEELSFFAANGFQVNNVVEELAIDLNHLPMYTIPMGYKFFSVDISTRANIDNYVYRINQYRTCDITSDFIVQHLNCSVCQAIAYFDSFNNPVAEIIVSGDVERGYACVIDLHVHPDYRGKGLAKSLLADVGRILKGMGFQTALIHAQLSDKAQSGVLKNFITEKKGVVNIIPSIILH